MFGDDNDSIRIPIDGGDDLEIGDAEAWAPPTAEEAEVQRLQQELAAAKDQCVRLVAEMDNFRRRMQDERTRQVNQATDQILREILTVVDDLELAATHDAVDSAAAMQKGVALIHDKLLRILAGLGVEVFASVGQPFDPYQHEAIECVPTNDYEENTVVRELQKGYVRGEKLLRPARVAVSTKPE